MTLDFLVRFNGRALGAFDLELLTSTPHDFAGVSRGSYGRVGLYGEGREPTATGNAKRFTIEVALVPTVAIEDRREKIDAVLAWLNGLVEIQIGTDPGRVMWGELDSGAAIRARWESVGMIDGPATFELSFVIAEGVSTSSGLRVLGVQADTPTAIPDLGTAPSAPVLIIPGAINDPEIEIRSADGSRASRLRMDGTASSSEWWEVRTEYQSIVEGRESDGRRIDVTGDFYRDGDFPVFDPSFGTESLPPTIESDHDLVAYYWEAWL